jgi:hypothetical protein
MFTNYNLKRKLIYKSYLQDMVGLDVSNFDISNLVLKSQDFIKFNHNDYLQIQSSGLYNIYIDYISNDLCELSLYINDLYEPCEVLKDNNNYIIYHNCVLFNNDVLKIKNNQYVDVNITYCNIKIKKIHTI